MYLISYDIGYDYLAYAIINNYDIIDFGIIEFMPYYEKLHEYINNTDFNKFDIILIENQPPSNAKTVKIQNILQYELYKYNVVLFNPAFKLFDIKIKNYKDRKNKSIEFSKKILKKYKPELLNKLIYYNKIDDITDAINQGLSYYLKHCKNPDDDFKDFIKEIINLS